MEIAELMKTLDISEEEAKELAEFDKAIDRDKRTTDPNLTKEQKKIIKQYTGTGTREGKSTGTRIKKANPTKANLIAALAEFLKREAEQVTVTNAERQIAFAIGADTFELTLTQKRKPKEK